MKIILYSHLFYPSVGGIETIANQMAENFVNLGQECTLVTHSVRTDSANDDYPFPVVRRASFKEKIRLVKNSDIVYSNGASVNLFWISWFLGKPFVWTHQGYQLSCIDGLGWVDGYASPMNPFRSFLFHLKKSGIVYSVLGYAKLMLRILAGKLVAKNVAVTTWVAYRQPLPKQIVLHTPYRVNRFASIADKTEDQMYDFFFVGRLVSEKGVATLLRAFDLIVKNNPSYFGKLLLIGDGAWRKGLEILSNEMGLNARVDFVGKQTGDDLLKWVSKGKIAVIPSEWEEPMGGVCLEMMAAGKPIIVSRKGGMAECVGEAGLVFENGDSVQLAEKMWILFQDDLLQQKSKLEAKKQLKKLDEMLLTKQYVDLFQGFVKK